MSGLELQNVCAETAESPSTVFHAVVLHIHIYGRKVEGCTVKSGNNGIDAHGPPGYISDITQARYRRPVWINVRMSTSVAFG